MEEEALDQDDIQEERRPRRGAYPRFGSFVTIAIALLMLFGAASRLGKVPETAALFGMDTLADQRIKNEEERLRTVISLGAVPVPMEELRPEAGRLPIDANPTPPSRGEVELRDRPLRPNGYDAGRNALSMPIPEEHWSDALTQGRDTPAPVRQQNQPQGGARHPSTYVVENGDTWNKIALRTLGDGKRWQDILNANPEAREGLKVGMKLTIPN